MALGFLELLIVLFVCGVPLLLGIVFVVVLATRTRSQSPGQSSTQSPLEVLQQRYARGEIDTAEYEKRRDRILSDSS